MPSRIKRKVVIYSRPGCHLCEEAKAVMLAADCAADYSLTEVNIESDPALLAKYKNDIPVITIDGRDAFHHRLTRGQFIRKILYDS